MLYAEKLTKEVKKGNATKTVHNQEKADKKNRGRAAEDEDEDEDDAIEDELGVAQQAEADTDRMMSDISENEICGRGLLGLFGENLCPLELVSLGLQDLQFCHTDAKLHVFPFFVSQQKDR